MPITAAEAFKKRHITRKDGVQVLPRPMITVAALEAGYHLPSPTIDEAVAHTTYHGHMTAQEFSEFCEQHKESFVSARALAKAVVVVAPSNVITRGSLEEIISKSSTPEVALSEEEVDTLFHTLDTDNKGAIDAEDFMRALHGEEGVTCLREQRRADAKEAREQIAKAERDARRAEEERKRKEAEEAAKKSAKPAKKEKDSACC